MHGYGAYNENYYIENSEKNYEHNNFSPSHGPIPRWWVQLFDIFMKHDCEYIRICNTGNHERHVMCSITN